MTSPAASFPSCDCCKDGYLIVRTKDRTPFLGCTNYKADKSGCNRKINLTYYENMLTHIAASRVLTY